MLLKLHYRYSRALKNIFFGVKIRFEVEIAQYWAFLTKIDYFIPLLLAELFKNYCVGGLYLLQNLHLDFSYMPWKLLPCILVS